MYTTVHYTTMPLPPKNVHRNQTKGNDRNKNNTIRQRIPIASGNITVKGDNIIVARKKEYWDKLRIVPIKYDIHKLARVSKLIANIINNGYKNRELEPLLNHLHITAQPCDIFTLLTTTDELAFNAILHNLGIETVIQICDELRVSCIIDKIINARIILDRVHHTQIINHHITDNNLVTAYDMGYKPIPYKSNVQCDTVTAVSNINNAINNGLYATNLALLMHCRSPHGVTGLLNIADNFAEFKNLEIVCDEIHMNKSLKVDEEVLELCARAEKIHIHGMNACNDDYIAAVRNSNFMKNVVVAHESRSNCMQFILTLAHNTHNTTHLHTLNLDNNVYIRTCYPFARSLRVLHARGKWCVLCDEGIAQCSRLKELHVANNPNIKTCAPFAKTLRVLDASSRYSRINDQSIASCTKLVQLCVCDNTLVTTCEPFAKTLRVLHITNHYTYCNIWNDNGLKLCTKLRELYAYGNSSITTCAPFANSIVISNIGGYRCGFTNDEIKMCKKLRVLQVTDNSTINIARHDMNCHSRSKFKCECMQLC